MGQSRTANVFRNSFFGISCQILNFLLNFVARTIFIRELGIEYLGVNGLFTNILTVLSFAELGIGSAITYHLYKPLAEGDPERIRSLMLLYKRAYQIVGGIVLAAGAAVMPFLPFLIKEAPNISENLYFIYALFLFDTGSSYFLVYKKSLLIAGQKNYWVVLINEAVHLLQIVVQLLVLLLTHNYILFLIISISCTILKNLTAALLTDRIFPYLRGKAAMPTKEERSGIFQNVKNLALYKFGTVILNGTDNILISSMAGLTTVGLASNYTLITTSCNAIIGKIEEAFIASVGNLNTNAPSEKKYDIFKKMLFITFWIYGFVTAGIVAATNGFIEAWIGEDKLLSLGVVTALALGFFVSGMHNPAYIYRTTLGYFKEGRFSPIVSAVINVGLSIAFFQFMGVAGIYLATPIALFLSLGIVDPVLIYKKAFFVSPVRYYLVYFGYLALQTALTAVCLQICYYVSVQGWLGVILKALIVSVVYNLLCLLIFCRSKMFRELFKMLIGMLKKEKTNV